VLEDDRPSLPPVTVARQNAHPSSPSRIDQRKAKAASEPAPLVKDAPQNTTASEVATIGHVRRQPGWAEALPQARTVRAPQATTTKPIAVATTSPAANGLVALAQLRAVIRRPDSNSQPRTNPAAARANSKVAGVSRWRVVSTCDKRVLPDSCRANSL
jgi:hypothetical protein